MSNKKILIIVAIIIALVVLVWLVVKNNSTPASQTATTQQTQSFFPVGALKEIVSQVTNIGDQLTETVQDLGFGEDEPAEQGPFMKISDEPVADYGFITLNGTSTLFFVDQASGNFYLYQNGEKSRLTNKTIPRIKGVAVAGNKIVLKTLNEDGGLIFYLTQISSTSSPELSLKELESNIIEIIASPDQKQFFKLLQLDNGVVGYLTDLNLKNKTKVFESPLSEWVIDWPNQNIITLYSKPSFGISGSMYKISLKENVLSNVLSKINGLVGVVSPDGLSVVYSENTSLGSLLQVKNLKNSNLSTSPEFYGLAEKCAWFKFSSLMACGIPQNISNSIIPDQWYQGLFSANDDIWVVDVASGMSFSIFNQKETNTTPVVDIYRPIIDPNNPKLLFINKKDSLLYSAELSFEID